MIVPSKPNVVLMCGLPASGKTTAAARLHRAFGGVLIRSCDVYADLGISLPDWVRRTHGFTRHAPAYERERDRAYVELARRLDAALAVASRPVIVDAVHGERAKRRMMCDIAWRYREAVTLLWCQCDSAREVRRRFAARQGRRAMREDEASDLSVFSHVASLWQDPTRDRRADGAFGIVIYDSLRQRVAAVDVLGLAMRDVIADALSRPSPSRRPQPAWPRTPDARRRARAGS